MKLAEKSSYINILPFLAEVDINHYFAKSVLTQRAKGKVFVDDEITPSSFYITSGYGMSLLFGKTNNHEFNLQLRDYLLDNNNDRETDEWLQVYPSHWNSILAKLCDDKLILSKESDSNDKLNCIVQNTRVNFEFNEDKFKQAIATQKSHLSEHVIKEIDKNMFQQLDGVVVPKYFWLSAESFIKYGKGFVLMVEDSVASTAYSATIDESILEIGIETNPAFRGNGYAFTICRKIIEHSLANKLIPVWACKLENTASYFLAQKLGFTVSKKLPYYRLCRNS
jgi:hypothetical protein